MAYHKRDNTGSSENSWRKHGLIKQAAWGQVAAYQVKNPTHRCVIIDMHAGRGDGIPLPQLDFFREPISFPTAELAMHLAQKFSSCDVILCEKKGAYRAQLATRFPTATVLPDHRLVPALIKSHYQWGLVLNDPNGYSEHGVDTMEQIAAQMRTDWIVVFNEGGLSRILGMQERGLPRDIPFVTRVRHARAQYMWMAEPCTWAQRLHVPHMARSRLIHGSAAFRYRILVLSYRLSDTLRLPLWETIL